MKSGIRLYINLTNACNVECPFCCMYSSPNKKNYLTFKQYADIIDSSNTEFELQLEGGEPFLHDGLWLFIYYAINTKRCKKIIILSNGMLLKDNLNYLVSTAVKNKIHIELKLSINYYLIEQYKNNYRNLFNEFGNISFAVKYVDYVNVKFNVRKRSGDIDDWIDNELKNNNIYEYSNIYYLQAYGKLKNSKYEKPIIVQNIEDWKIYASDGTCFNQDLIARSEYEKNIK